MKKILIALALCFGLGTLRAWSASQPHSLGIVTASTTTFTGAILPWPRTLAQINVLQSGATGQIVLCSNCVKTAICVSSGTVGLGAWVVPIISTGNAGPYTAAHCQ